MEFSRQEYWSDLPFPSSGRLPKPGALLVAQTVKNVPATQGDIVIHHIYICVCVCVRVCVCLLYSYLATLHHVVGKH